MPENTKNNQPKNKNEPKEQRRKRQNRHPPGPVEKRVEKEAEHPKVIEKPAPPYVEPPPEFYQNLKRETEDILKITEEANSKYKKKEIQSNWAKYEMPIESYEEIDEQESIGADFESLIQASLSVGGHFQFKHEKTWDTSTGPSPYDKYFDINMDNLNLALSSIPFYERNNIDVSLFTETDLQTMNHRATKYKNKYFNDKKYTTPELEAENKILSTLIKKEEDEFKEKVNNDENVSVVLDNMCTINNDSNKEIEETKFVPPVKQTCTVRNELNMLESKEVQEHDRKEKEDEENLLENLLQVKEMCIDGPKVNLESSLEQEKHNKGVESVPEKESRNPIMESPEDLEKWLDDFLDE